MMKRITILENVVMNKTGACREVANEVVVSIINELDKFDCLVCPDSIDDIETIGIGQYHGLED